MSRSIGAALAALLIASPALAQARLVFDLSGGSTRHQFAEPGTALTVAPRFLWRTPGARLDLGLTYTRGASFKWNAEGGLDAAVARRLGGGFSAELSTQGWWTVHPVGQGTGQVSLAPALRWSGRAMDLEVTAGGGHASTVTGGRWFTSLGTRGRWTLGPIDVSTQVQRTQFSQQTLRWHAAWEESPHGRPDTLAPDTLSAIRNYSDVGITLGWTLAKTRMSTSLEQRVGVKEFRATAWHFEATRVVAPELALFGSAGQTLSALAAGLPARRYVALGLRWAPGSPRLSKTGVSNDARRVRIERAGDEAAMVLLRVDGATSVEVMGDFTDWEPRSLTTSGEGWWRLPVPLAPGLYRLNIRRDGGAWEVPPGMPSEQDEFNGRVGVLLIVP
jgi:hypothetical protein